MQTPSVAAAAVNVAVDAGATTDSSGAVLLYAEELKQTRRKNKRYNRCITVTVGVVAGLSVVTGLTAMFIEASVIAYLAFMFPFFTAPYTILQRRKLNKMPKLRQEINHIRKTVNRLIVQNVKFKDANDRLEVEVHRLSDVERQLEHIAERAGTNVNEIQRLVAENGSVQREMKELQTAIEMQQLLTAVLQSDRNGDFKLSDAEANELLLRLEAMSNKPIDKTNMKLLLQKKYQSLSTTSLYNELSDGLDGIYGDGDADDVFEDEDRDAELGEAGGNNTDITPGCVSCVDTSFGYRRGSID